MRLALRLAIIPALLLFLAFTGVKQSWAKDSDDSPNENNPCEYLLTSGLPYKQTHFENTTGIKTPEDAIRFWRGVDRAVANEKYSWRNITKLDYARPLLLIRDQFTSEQVKELSQIFDSLRVREFGEWNRILLPAKILFKPELAETYFEFEEDISEYAPLIAHEKSYATDFNFATVTALRSLPAAQKNKMKEFFYAKILELRKRPPLNKFVRRNAEILYRALFEDEFQDFLASLVRNSSSGKMSVQIAKQEISKYWAQLGFGSSYDFEDVLSIARLLQDGPLTPFIGDNFVYLYGSFANGAAIFPDSDVDLHLSPSLEKQFDQLFGRHEGTFAKPEKGMMKELYEPVQKSFFELEKAIAATLGIRRKYIPFLSGYKRGNLLSVSTGAGLFAPQDWFTPKYMQQQSPIMLKVSKNKIVLQVYDAYYSRRLFEVVLD